MSRRWSGSHQLVSGRQWRHLRIELTFNCGNRSQSHTRPFSAQALLVQSHHCCRRQLMQTLKVDAQHFHDLVGTLLDHWQPTSRDALQKLHHRCDNETHTSAWFAV
jgi:hypothetical protein